MGFWKLDLLAVTSSAASRGDPVGASDFHDLVVNAKKQERRSPLANEQSLVIFAYNLCDHVLMRISRGFG